MSKKQKMTMEDVGELVKQYAHAHNEAEKLKVRLNGALARVKDEYKPKLETAADARSGIAKQIRAWAKGEKARFEATRSIQFLHGTVGFRLTPPAVETAGDLTDAEVIRCIERAGFGKYLRTVQEIDREAILRDRSELGEDALARMCLVISQRDEFFIDPKQDVAAPAGA